VSGRRGNGERVADLTIGREATALALFGFAVRQFAGDADRA
jgi:hypothetical protein